MTKKIAALLLGLSALAVLAGCEAGDSDKSPAGQGPDVTEVKTYRIGVIAPLSGDAGAYGVELNRVWEYQLEEINRKARLKGHQFELAQEDGKCEGAAAATALQKLTDIDGIKVLIAGACSAESLGLTPMLEQKEAVALSPTSSNPDLNGSSPNFFSLSYSDSLVGEEIAKVLAAHKKVAIITEQADYSEGLRKDIKQYLTANAPETEIVADEVFPKGGTEMRTLLAKIHASEAEIVFLNPNAGVTAISLVKQLAEIEGWNKALVSQFSMMAKDALEAAPKTLEGMLIIDAPNIVNGDLQQLLDRVIAAKGTLDTLGPYYSASAADALDIITTLTAEFDGDAEKIRQALATRNFGGWLAPSFNFGGKTFVQGVGVAKYRVINAEAILQ